MKSHLRNINRVTEQIDKLKYNLVLNQGERNAEIPSELFERFKSTLTQKDIFFYPNTNKFKKRLAEFYDVDYEELFLSAGSDVGIKAVFESIVDGGNVIGSNPAFPMYKVYSELYKSEYIGIEFEDNFILSIEKLLEVINSETKLIVLANPNSPIGEWKEFSQIKKILDTGIPVLIDEAYIEYSGQESLIKYIGEYDNLFITRTFSKALGSAGCRIGCVISNKNNIEIISKIRHMYEISGLSIKWAEFLLDNYEIVFDYIDCVKSIRDTNESSFLYKSYTNSVCVNEKINLDNVAIKTLNIHGIERDYFNIDCTDVINFKKHKYD